MEALVIQPTRRRYDPDNSFFDAGNDERNLWYKFLSPSQKDSRSTGMEMRCDINGCKQNFENMLKLQQHQTFAHQNQCATCKRHLFSDKLLSMHISETHDSFFKALAAKRPCYECFVTGCGLFLLSDKDRKVHLIEIHQFPPSFDFNEPFKYHSYCQLSKIQMKKMGGMRKKLVGESKSLSGASSSSGLLPPPCDEMDKESMMDANESSAFTRGEESFSVASAKSTRGGERRSGQGASSRQQPHPPRLCRNFSASGFCSFGDKCFFSHQSRYEFIHNPRGVNSHCATSSPSETDGMQVTEGHEAAEGQDGEVDGLADVLFSRFKISAPPKVSFGRRKNKGLG